MVQVGDDAGAQVYVENARRYSKEVGIRVIHVHLPQETTQTQLEYELEKLNGEEAIHAILVLLPINANEKINTNKINDKVSPDKDVEGLNRRNLGRLGHGQLQGIPIQGLAKGVLPLVESTGIDVEGKHVVVLGRTRIGGGPAAQLFIWHNATVTVCHEKSENIEEFSRTADILFVAMGEAEIVKGSWIKPGAVVIDAGFHVLKGHGPGGKDKYVGDVDFESGKQVAGDITPVPGGVGPMIVAMLLRNTLHLAINHVESVNRQFRSQFADFWSDSS